MVSNPGTSAASPARAGFFRAGDQHGWIARAARRFDRRNGMSGDAPRHFDHLAHAEALRHCPGCKSAGWDSGACSRACQGQQVRARQIADVDVIADTGAVRRRVVGAENSTMFGAAKGDLENPRDQVRFRMVRFALVGTRRAGGVEISQAGVAQAVNPVEPRRACAPPAASIRRRHWSDRGERPPRSECARDCRRARPSRRKRNA